ncbi:MAG: tRNA (adenosine(37)-N6)-threonylcarbamoyltransferase complex transferase subunit TsaD [Candidatus Nealsonbacteria bacterium CG_4_9_14_3_um_filter_35_11]|uniref:tRNA N6-adenosine threonylcarbamoyltransferase n=2 Tax=Candidatus Nealsoniibacteriota TaxID=1817911 RepID=A0A2M7DAT6_9BACT|nr:MAG: tRNA (adenosine(37)-N6)-threonylcarbamoyltransferase complex transferase subunit TsaD [Candidatus Nealsonbacteria bacterium CG11_big_fil_rev_8_21_14_0_20_35_11]PIV45585.1 MAG: tRNA (adenosine(37)-N6)-threonylcarbamoyltransferase complex transferase subunit TsaD [Candidatus Nealsonbacteria bacterium CG02_land_8_20_14_3_00_34_20]PIW92608.1 MAG: tRNA (adenosine(37)-N6)-threonylcarbamoyltransferase complex transferase subunit TsaD [Candidatus Nealsonbacteria bacterium CG_4_8_14_3_um_filter_34
MKVLAIETSCDDTCISLIEGKKGKVEPKFRILSNIVSPQVKIHRKYGGIYPTLAKREHQKNLVPVLKKALKKAGLLRKIFLNCGAITKRREAPTGSSFQTLKKILRGDSDLLKNLTKFLKIYQKPKIDAIAVTIGPGLEPCLWQGVNFAKSLSFWWNLPIIPANHIEAHIIANFLPKVSSNFQFSISNFQNIFPAICLVVSGGHTQLILMNDIGKYKIIGETRDDAAGECFDKTARILGLGYPGGPAIDAEAAKNINSRFQIPDSIFQIKLPRPMLHSKNYDFSFSGLKTAVLYKVKNEKRKTKNKKYIRAMAAEIQQAVIDVLISKTLKAAKNFKARTIILGGGVAANNELKKQFKSKIKKEIPNSLFLIPDSKFCTDNAAMIGATALLRWETKTTSWQKIKANANLRIKYGL